MVQAPEYRNNYNLNIIKKKNGEYTKHTNNGHAVKTSIEIKNIAGL